MVTDLQRLHQDSSDRSTRPAEKGPDLASPVDAFHDPLQVLRVVVGGVLESFARQRASVQEEIGIGMKNVAYVFHARKPCRDSVAKYF